MKYYYYTRISTIKQSSKRQIENFRRHPHFNLKMLFQDKVQGNVPFFERTNAKKLFDLVTEDKSTIIVDSIDRLGRNLQDVLKTIEYCTQNKINVESLKEGFSTLNREGKKNPIATLLVGILGSISEMERIRIKERQAEGIAIAKAEGKFSGRKAGTYQSIETLLIRHPLIVSKLKKGLTYKEIQKITGKSTATISKVKKALQKRKELIY